MERQRSGRSLALVEIIIAIGVLAIVSVFVLEMFARASNITNKARDKDRAGFEAQSMIELFKSDVDLTASVDVGRVVVRTAPDTYELYFSSGFTPVAQRDEQGYALTMTVTPQNTLDGVSVDWGRWETLTVSVVKLAPYLLSDEDDVEILKVSAGVYRPGEAVAG